ncbi:MAG: hypothetical protein B7Y26_04945 [Hydrogenophilales bacterium 16-64-46]|nr:MAG: hypothetical protein B7Z32_04245 [Hydrogenophilales bacterium 12-64-13]OYZ06315.1 MAG: hypothetical protein B7Y26_04945 [Hydrogenophilales bacterium 16-64-46]OZA38786.1 MAG: hypothetical protein B7X87_04945 [Hydrogenophilales bacterium 17-64-34]
MCKMARMMGITVLMLLGICAGRGMAAETPLGIPALTDGYPTDVGLIIIGHSTSATGDYPAKLARTLNSTTSDGRNYVVLPVIGRGDGGFLWSKTKIMPEDVLYNRITASEEGVQWEQTSDGARWSCRRLELDRALGIAEETTACGDSQPEVVRCKYHDADGPQFGETWEECLQNMDVRIALVQDTSNRSWPIDDYNENGRVSPDDYFVADRVGDTDAMVDHACPPGYESTGVLPYATRSDTVQAVDWNCDNNLSNIGDSAIRLAARWLVDLATHLRANRTDYVFFTQKPMEMTGSTACDKFFPGENCANGLHESRLPSDITPSRPMTGYYLPSVYWEHRVMETLANMATFDATRMFLINPDNTQYMWQQSVACYETGLVSANWAIPATLPPFQRTFSGDTGETDVWGGDSASRGCMAEDHVHHNTKGGWLMADVWYRGLLPYLQ